MAKKATRKKPATKKVTAKKKLARARKSAPRKKPSRKSAKRYTDQEKAEIVQFVRDHDKARGRGGQTAAVKKFGVTQITVAKWLKDAGKRKRKGVARRKPETPVAPGHTKENTVVDTLQRMLAIQRQIGELQCEFEGLKGKL
jgi:transposase-like protein